MARINGTDDMTVLTDYIAQIKEWIDDQDPPEALVTDWIRDGEERINNELRTDVQIERQYATFDDNCALLPDNWLETIYVRLKGGRPFHFVTNDSYWDLKAPASYAQQPDPSGEIYPWPGQKMHYTTIGRTIFVWPPINPEALTSIEICYYRKITPMVDAIDPIVARYPTILRNCTIAASMPYLVDRDDLQTYSALATAAIERANQASKKARFSGSPIAPRIRSFG
jgi:hypothetical protein